MTPNTDYWNECSSCRKPCVAKRVQQTHFAQYRSSCCNALIIARHSEDSLVPKAAT